MASFRTSSLAGAQVPGRQLERDDAAGTGLRLEEDGRADLAADAGEHPSGRPGLIGGARVQAVERAERVADAKALVRPPSARIDAPSGPGGVDECGGGARVGWRGREVDLQPEPGPA